MATEDNDDSRSVALYWDFENLHAGLMEAKYGEGAYAKQDNRFKVQEPLIDVQALVELGASFGPVAINRAYGNWQYFGRYRDARCKSSPEFIKPGSRANGTGSLTLVDGGRAALERELLWLVALGNADAPRAIELQRLLSARRPGSLRLVGQIVDETGGADDPEASADR